MMSSHGGGGNGDDDKPLFELKLSLGDSGPTMAQEMEKAKEARLQLKQEIEAGQHAGPVKVAMSKLDEAFNDASDLNVLSQGEQGALKKALATELVAGNWEKGAMGYVAMDEQSGHLVCKHNDFMYTSIDVHAVLEAYQAELDEVLARDVNTPLPILRQAQPMDQDAQSSQTVATWEQTKEELDIPKVEQADQTNQTNQVDTTTPNQQSQFEVPQEIPEQDLTDYDRALQNELEHLRQSLVPTSEVSQERVEQEQELNSLMRDVAEGEKMIEREEIVQLTLQSEMNQDENNLLRQLELDILEQELINQLLAEQIAENYRYSHINAAQLEIDHTYGHYDEEGKPIYGVEVDGQRYEVHLEEALTDTPQDTHTSSTDNVEAMQERIAELQAIQAQEQLEEESIASRIQEIQEEQAQRTESYYAALEHQEESGLQNNGDTPSFNDELVGNNTTEVTATNTTEDKHDELELPSIAYTEITDENIAQLTIDLEGMAQQYQPLKTIPPEKDLTLVEQGQALLTEVFSAAHIAKEIGASGMSGAYAKVGAGIYGATSVASGASVDDAYEGAKDLQKQYTYTPDAFTQQSLEPLVTPINQFAESVYESAEDAYGAPTAALMGQGLETLTELAGVAGLKHGLTGIRNMEITGQFNKLPSNSNIAHHIKSVDGFEKNGSGIKGAHNKDSFIQGLKDHNLQLVNEVKGKKGLSEITYGREKFDGRGNPDGFKNYTQPKTVYDPKVYSDKEMFQMGKEAALKGYKNAIFQEKTQYSETVNGIRFQVYINPQGSITNFHPTLKGK